MEGSNEKRKAKDCRAGGCGFLFSHQILLLCLECNQREIK